jgi:hypothetical protein
MEACTTKRPKMKTKSRLRLKLIVPQEWKPVTGCAGVDSYCGHSQRSHEGGHGHCRVSYGESICWCKRWKPINSKKYMRKNLLSLARECGPALSNLIRITDSKTQSVLKLLQKGLSGEIRRLSRTKGSK